MTISVPLKLKLTFHAVFTNCNKNILTLGKKTALWDIAQRKQLWSVCPLKNSSSISIDRLGKRVAVKNTQGQICVLDAKTGKIVFDHMNKSEGEGSNLLFTHDCKSIIDGSWEGVLTVRNASKPKFTDTRVFDENMITQIATHRTTPVFAIFRNRIMTDESTVTLWKEGTPLGKAKTLRRFELFTAVNQCMAPTMPTPTQVFIADGTKILRFNTVRHETVVDIGGADPIIAIDYDPINRAFAIATESRAFVYRLRDQTQHELHEDDHLCDIRFSPDSGMVAVGSWGSGLVVANPVSR